MSQTYLPWREEGLGKPVYHVTGSSRVCPVDKCTCLSFKLKTWKSRPRVFLASVAFLLVYAVLHHWCLFIENTGTVVILYLFELLFDRCLFPLLDHSVFCVLLTTVFPGTRMMLDSQMMFNKYLLKIERMDKRLWYWFSESYEDYFLFFLVRISAVLWMFFNF